MSIAELKQRAYTELVTCDFHGPVIKRAVLDEIFTILERYLEKEVNEHESI